ncbi:MAG: hypothetical protein JRF33_19070 [Deltaproteobacteria bacterium]|nr:hypothetical protein [Deltaproteobacteria bacterium]
MQAIEKVLLLIDPINRLGLPYMVTGSVASIVYGEPRMTQDVDLVLHLRPGDVKPLLDTYGEQDFYCPPEENLRQELRRSQRGHFNIIHHASGFKADVYLMEQSPLQTWAMARKHRLELTKSSFLWLAPMEYVIVQKLLYYREGGSDKHLRDIRGMMLLSQEQLDGDALHDWIAKLGLDAEWTQITSSI